MNIDKVLNMIKHKGYEAYIVGGYVRDYILFKTQSRDIDIATNAPLEILLEMFSDYNPKSFKYNTLKFKINDDNFDIAHFRSEKLINGTLNVEFTSSIEEDSKRRDFTINAIYFDGNKYIDFYNGIKDCENHILSFIGNPLTRLNEDSTRILRYIYFYVKYDLNYKNDEYEIIKDNAMDYLKECSTHDINKYVVKILDSNKIDKFIQILIDLKVLDFFFDIDNESSFDIHNLFNSTNYKYYDLLPKRFK